MEPLSIWAFTVIAAALGIGLSVVGKKKSGKCCASEPKAKPVVKTTQVVAEKSEVFDADKEKAIDDLIADKH